MVEKEIEGGQCEKERVVHPSEKPRRFVSKFTNKSGRRNSPTAVRLQHWRASESSRSARGSPVPVPPFNSLLHSTPQALRRIEGARGPGWEGGDRGTRPGSDAILPGLQTCRASACNLAGPSGSTHSTVATGERKREVWGSEKGRKLLPKARLQLGSRKSPEDQLPTCCRPSWGARSSHPAAAGLPGRARRLEAEAAAAGCRRGPSRGRGRRSLPSPGGSRARARDWPAAAGGRSQAGRCRVDRLKRAQDIADRTGALASAQPAPAPTSWVLGILVCLGPTRFDKLLDLTCLRVPPLPLHVPHAPAPATGKGGCVFSSLLLSRCLCALGSGLGLRSPVLPCSSGAQLSRCCWSAHPRGRVPDHAYRVCVRTRTSPELKILRHAWNS